MEKIVYLKDGNNFDIRDGENMVIDRFIYLSIKNKNEILKDIKDKKTVNLIEKHYKKYCTDIEEHNKVIDKVKETIEDGRIEDASTLNRHIKLTDSFHIIHDIIVRNYVFTGNFI